MNRVVITAEGAVEIEEVPAPRAHRDLVVVQVRVAPLCTEFTHRAAGRRIAELGHEAAGIVVDAGESKRVHVGQRVVVMPQAGCGKCALCVRGDHIYCPAQRDVLTESGSSAGVGTLAEYLIKPDWLLLPVPDDISLEHAAMACCGFGPSFGALEKVGAAADDVVVVSGCGPVGLGAVTQAVGRGARTIAVEINPYRRALAGRLGAEVVDAGVDDVGRRLRELSSEEGATVGIETSGSARAVRTLAEGLGVGGRMIIVAWMTDDVVLPPLVPLGITVSGSWHWNHIEGEDRMWRAIRNAREKLPTLVTHRFGLADVDAAMTLQRSGACGKVIVQPFGAEEV